MRCVGCYQKSEKYRILPLRRLRRHLPLAGEDFVGRSFQSSPARGRWQAQPDGGGVRRSARESVPPIARDHHDFANHRFGIREHVACRIAHHLDAPAGEPFVANGIAQWPAAAVVGFPIDLDRQSDGCAIEIQSGEVIALRSRLALRLLLSEPSRRIAVLPLRRLRRHLPWRRGCRARGRFPARAERPARRKPRG